MPPSAGGLTRGVRQSFQELGGEWVCDKTRLHGTGEISAQKTPSSSSGASPEAPYQPVLPASPAYQTLQRPRTHVAPGVR